jgi:hypothetical protein
MSIGSVSSTSNAYATSAINGSTKSPSSIPPPVGGAAASANISKPGELFSKLQQLSQQDPAKFKQVAGQIGAELKTAANASGNTALSKLADQLTQASQSGSLTDPSQQSGAGKAHGHHHGHHHGGGGGGPSAASSGAQSPSSAVVSAFTNALDEVNQALAPTTSGTSTAKAST